MAPEKEDVNPRRGGFVFVFSPQGGQWLGMGRALYADESTFRQGLTECDREVRRNLGWSVVDLLMTDALQGWLTDPHYIQPVVTSLQIGLTGLLTARRIYPTAVVGLSLGEIAAAHAAAILNLDAAMRIACCQARLAKRPIRPGGMLVVQLGRPQVDELLREGHGGVTVGCELSPSMTVLAGEANALSRLDAHLKGRQIFVRRVNLGFAFHTSEMAPLEHEFLTSLADLHSAPAKIPFYSSVTGALEAGSRLGPAHWWKIMSQPAYFVGAIRAILQDGYAAFLEVGPHPSLAE